MALANHCNLLGRAPTASSLQIGNVDGPASGGSTDKALVRWNGTTGRLVQNGVVTEADYTGTLTGAVDQATTTAAGSAFMNQPSNDTVQVLSSSASDITQTVTIIGTTTATNTVVVETVTLNGTTAVPTVKTDWGVVLAVKKSAATVGTVTVRKATGTATITAGLTPAVLSVGVNTVTNTAAFNRALSAVASGATTKQIGFQGTNTAGTVIYDSQALNGTTAVASNSSFLTLTEIYGGDVEATRTVTVTTNGGWTLTGGGGATVSFDTLTGGLTLTPSGTGGIKTQFAATKAILGESPLSASAGLWFLDTAQAVTSSNYAIRSLGNGNVVSVNAGGALTFKISDSEVGRFVSTHLLLGGLTTDGTGVLQFPAATTTAGGITFGADTFLYRASAATLGIGSNTTTSGLNFYENGTFRGDISTSAGAMTVETSGAFSLLLRTNSITALTLDSSQNAQFVGKITSYNGVATAGNGVATVQGSGRATAQVAANASVATYTVGAADASFIVSANVNVTTATAHNFTVTCTYSDEGNTSRTLTMAFTQLTGSTLLTAITNITGAGPYESVPFHIRCKASTAITIATTGTFTTVTYNAEGAIVKLA